MDVEDKLCNISKGIVKYTHFRNTTSSAKDGGTIYVQFDNEKYDNKWNPNSLMGLQFVIIFESCYWHVKYSRSNLYFTQIYVLLMSKLLLVLIYRLPEANHREIRLWTEELTAQLEELHIDEHNKIILRNFNLDQMRDPYIDFFWHWLSQIFLLALLLPSVQIIIHIFICNIRSFFPQWKRDTSRMVIIAIQRSLCPSN